MKIIGNDYISTAQPEDDSLGKSESPQGKRYVEVPVVLECVAAWIVEEFNNIFVRLYTANPCFYGFINKAEGLGATNMWFKPLTLKEAREIVKSVQEADVVDLRKLGNYRINMMRDRQWVETWEETMSKFS